MNFYNSSSNFSRTIAHLMVVTIVIAFGAIGSVLARNFGEAYSFVGLFLGSALGAFVAVYESTIIGCIVGMIIGVLISPAIYYLIDFETAYLAVFISSLIGAIMGEPISSFWRETNYSDEEYDKDLSSKNNIESLTK